ncbi:MAG: transporter [Candidatus Omnitrophota bacterium]|nr:transporter [Candidatus Omnitrophota bacterium]
MLRRMFSSSLLIAALLLNDQICFAGHKDSEEEWNPVSAGPLTTWTAPLCGKGKLVIQPFFFYNRARGTFNADGRYNSLPAGDKKEQFQEQLFAQYGLTNRLELDAQMVYQQNYVKQGDAKAGASGFGDSYLFLRYCALEEKGRLPHLTGVFQLKIPTGKYEHANSSKLGADLMGATSGGGSWDQGLGINLSKKLKPFILHSDAIYSFPQQARVNGVKTRYANYLNYDFGVEYFLSKGFNLVLEVNGFLQGDKQENKAMTPDSKINYFTIAPGIGWSNAKIQTLIAYQRVLTGTNTDANDSVVFTLVYPF